MTKEEAAKKVLEDFEKKQGLPPGTVSKSIQQLAELDDSYKPLVEVLKE